MPKEVDNAVTANTVRESRARARGSKIASRSGGASDGIRDAYVVSLSSPAVSLNTFNLTQNGWL